MSNNIVLKRGLDLPVNGAAALKTSKTVAADVVAIKPTDFRGCTLRLLVREGDKVLAGSPVLADKKCPDIIFASPVSGTVAEIVRGDRRKLLAVLIKADAQNEAIDFGKKNVAGMKAEEIKEQLLKSGVWPFIVQRPYGILADPTVQPKAIFISAFSTAPLAADLEYTLGAEVENIQTAVDALAKLTAGGVHVCTNSIAAISIAHNTQLAGAVHNLELGGSHSILHSATRQAFLVESLLCDREDFGLGAFTSHHGQNRLQRKGTKKEQESLCSLHIHYI